MKSLLGLFSAAVLIATNAHKLEKGDFQSGIFKLDGPEAEDVLSGMSADVQVSYQDSDAKWQTYNMKPDAPNLVVFKTVGCPECEAMSHEWESLAETCRLKGINVNIDAIDREGNLKLLKKQGIYQYPTIRFFQLGQQHVDF